MKRWTNVFAREGKGGLRFGPEHCRTWREKSWSAMEDKNKEDAEYVQMQKENKGGRVAWTSRVKRAQKIRSGVEGGAFRCYSLSVHFLKKLTSV